MPDGTLIRTEGGPRPGTKVVTKNWPLPHLLMAEGGSYVKVSEVRPAPGAMATLSVVEYRWQAGDATADQLLDAISVAIKARRLAEVAALMQLLAVADPHSAGLIYDVVTLSAGDAR